MSAACTRVATEYHYHNSDEFHIEVEYFTEGELKSYFEELLVAWRVRLSLPAGHLFDDCDDFEKKAGAAFGTFYAMFGTHLCQKPGILSSETAIDDLMRWTSEMLSCHKNNAANHPVQKFKDEKSFSETLSKLTTGATDTGHDSLWPFVRKLKYV